MAVIIKIWAFISAAVVQGVPLLFGSTGEIITEKSGHLNLGIPGIMYMGGVSGIVGGFFIEDKVAAWNLVAESMSAGGASAFSLVAYRVMIYAVAIFVPLVFSLAGSALMALIYCFLTVTLKANQNVTGLALTTFGVGIGNFFGGSLVKMFGGEGSISLINVGNIYKSCLPVNIPAGEGKTISVSFGFLVYLSVIIAIIASRVIKKTRTGLNLRAVGENPATADAAGINVTRYRYVSTIVGAMIAGLGGLYFVMDYTGGAWTNDGFGDRGWLAIAIVIFALWKPSHSIWCSFLFGGLYIVCVQIPGVSAPVKELIKMLPYFVTVIVLIAVSIRDKRENQPPAALGTNYFREDR